MRRSFKKLTLFLGILIGIQGIGTLTLLAATPVDVLLTKEANESQVEAGDTITYTLTVTTKGSSLNPAQGLKVTDTLPEGLTVESVEAPGSYICSNTTSTIECNRADPLAIGASEVITVKAKVGVGIADETILTNDAQADPIGNSSEDTPADNSSSADVEIVTCGNDQLAFSEACDDGNTKNGDCCSSKCTYDPEGTACDEGNPFTRGRCDGSGFCELDQLTLDEAIANCSLNRDGTGSQKAWWVLLPLGFFLLRRQVIAS